MIESTFVLLKGVGDKTERRWWEAGIVDWSDFLSHSRVPGLSSERKHWYDDDLRRAREALSARDGAHFASCLRPRDHWRLFPLFRDQAVYLDIETTGDDPGPDTVTVVGLFTHGSCVQLVEGHDLSKRVLSQLLEQKPFLVTFFGSVFDIPYLKQVYAELPVPPLHFDLCFAARRLGLTGGLKTVERRTGLVRSSDLVGLDGWDAVRLWRQYRQGESHALDRLLRYNRADTEHLVPLAEHLYDALVETHGPHLARHASA